MITEKHMISVLRKQGFTDRKAKDIIAEAKQISASQTHKAGKGVGAKPGNFNPKLRAL